MSLINQMLKDLETNRRQNDKAPAILRKLRSVSESRSKRLFHPAWLIVLAIAIVAAIVWLIPAKQPVLAREVELHSKALAHAVQATQPKAVMPEKPSEKTPISSKQEAHEAKQAITSEKPALNTAQQTVLQPKQSTDKPKPEVKTEAMVRHATQQTQVVVKQAVPVDDQEKLVALYQQAQNELDMSDDDSAITDLTKVLSFKPSYLQARELLATVLLSDNRLDEANKVVDFGLQRMPHYAPYTNIKARILMNEGKIKQAIAMLNQASPEMETSPEYYALLAALYQQDEEYMLSAQLYHQLVKLDPANAIWWMGLGIALESAEKNNAALEAFQKASSAVGLSPEAKAYVQQQVDKLS